jgi:hypothetical protein
MMEIAISRANFAVRQIMACLAWLASATHTASGGGGTFGVAVHGHWLVQEWSTSRQTVRKALHVMETEGLIRHPWTHRRRCCHEPGTSSGHRR